MEGRCLICNQVPYSYYYCDFRGQVVCRHHMNQVKICGCCNAFIDDLSNATNAGCNTYICNYCMSNHVTQGNMERYIKMTLEILYNVGFQDIQRDWIDIKIISRQEMADIMESASAVGIHFEQSPSQLSIQGRSGFDQAVQILEYLSPIEFMSVLGHEILHSWHLQNNIDEYIKYHFERDEECRLACEGLAQFGSFIIYDFFDSVKFNKEIREYVLYRKHLMLKDRDEAYGISFQKLLKQFPKSDKGTYLDLIKVARQSKLRDYLK